MLPAGKTSRSTETCEGLKELIQDPKSFGFREPLPRRVLDLLGSARRMLLEYAYDETRTLPADHELASELSQDADSNYALKEGRSALPFNVLLRRRMEQLCLSPHDIAVSLGSTLQYVSDLRDGIKTPTEQRIVELAALLEVTQETLGVAVTEQRNARAATASIHW